MTKQDALLSREHDLITGFNASTFQISDSAAKRIAHLVDDEPVGSRLRISIDGGGCSGFQYIYVSWRDSGD